MIYLGPYNKYFLNSWGLSFYNHDLLVYEMVYVGDKSRVIG